MNPQAARRCQCRVKLDAKLEPIEHSDGECKNTATFIVMEERVSPDQACYCCDNHLKIVCQGIGSVTVWWSPFGYSVRS